MEIVLLGSLEDSLLESTADGAGFRLVLFLAGCSHHCPGCHNPHSWEIEAGHVYPVAEVAGTLADRLETGPYAGLTLSGGDPLYQSQAVDLLLRLLRERHPDLNVWCYTGYRYEQIVHRPVLRRIDILVDGPYVASLRESAGPFRGSANQRLLHLEQGQICHQV